MREVAGGLSKDTTEKVCKRQGSNQYNLRDE